MGLVPALNHPTSGTANPVALTDNDDAIRTVVNGQIDENNITAASITATSLASNAVTTAKITDANVTAAKLADAAKLGLDDGTSVRRGKCIIATEESTSSTSYTTLTTPDRVQNVVLPTDGLIFVLYEAAMKDTAANGGYAAIFIGSNQLKTTYDAAAAAVQEAPASASGATYNIYHQLISTPAGLVTLLHPTSTPYSGGVTTGQTIAGIQVTTPPSGVATVFRINGSNHSFANPNLHGGVCAVYAAAGTYTVSIQYKATSGSVYAKERKLWVWTMGF